MKIGSPFPHHKARIEIIPLIDIMFFLLASFMLASLSMIRLHSIKMDLPTATVAKRDFNQDILNIGVDKLRNVYSEKKEVNYVELQSFLSNELRVITYFHVYASVDSAANQGNTVQH